MAKWRRAAKVDANQPGIVQALRKIPGVTVEVGHDDILVGHNGRTYWFELKPESAVGADGEVLASKVKGTQRELEKTWQGHYRIVWSLDQILADMGITGG